MVTQSRASVCKPTQTQRIDCGLVVGKLSTDTHRRRRRSNSGNYPFRRLGILSWYRVSGVLRKSDSYGMGTGSNSERARVAVWPRSRKPRVGSNFSGPTHKRCILPDIDIA